MSSIMNTFYENLCDDTLFAFHKIDLNEDDLGEQTVIVYGDYVTESEIDALKSYARGKVTYFVSKCNNGLNDLRIICYASKPTESYKITKN